MASKEIVPTAENVEELLTREAVAEVEDPDEISRQIMARIMQAETPEDVLTMAGTTSAADILEQPFVLTEVRFVRSSFDEGPGVFGILSCVLSDTGEVVPVTCGGRNVMAQAFRLQGLGALPRRVKIVEAGRETARGYRPMWLQPAD